MQLEQVLLYKYNQQHNHTCVTAHSVLYFKTVHGPTIPPNTNTSIGWRRVLLSTYSKVLHTIIYNFSGQTGFNYFFLDDVVYKKNEMSFLAYSVHVYAQTTNTHSRKFPCVHETPRLEPKTIKV